MISTRTLLVTGQLFLLALAALFSASTLNALIAGHYRSAPKLSLAPVAAQRAPATRRPLSDYASISARDVFNPPRPVEAAAPPAPVSELKAKLIGTAPSPNSDSFAIIEDDTNKTQQLYRVGDSLQGRTLTAVEWDHVMLKGPRGQEVLKIIEATGRPGAASAAPAVGIASRGDNDFVIDRSEIDKSLENMNQLFTQIRAVPHFQDGKAAGFRLFAIRQDSVFEKIGLKNGDIITKINGNELTDPARAMALIQELRSEGHIAVDVMRNRQPTTLNYEIR